MDWIKLRKEYESTEISLSDLAVKHGLKYPTVKSRKQREKWKKGASPKDASKNKKDASKGASKKTQDASKGDATKREPKIKIIVNNREIEIEENTDLTEKQRLFCLYFIKNRNATMAAIRAGYAKDSAHAEGSRLLKNVKIREELKRLKGPLVKEAFLDAMDVLQEYMKIAFADITEYVEFGVVERYVYKEGQKVKGENGEFLKEFVNYINLKNHDELDGALISEVKEGKEGLSIKLHDKMKALEKLEQYLDLLPDKHKRRIEEEKLKLDQAKFEADKLKATGGAGIDANNERILTLAKLLNNPVPNRNIEDFEDDDGGDAPVGGDQPHD